MSLPELENYAIETVTKYLLRTYIERGICPKEENVSRDLSTFYHELDMLTIPIILPEETKGKIAIFVFEREYKLLEKMADASAKAGIQAVREGFTEFKISTKIEHLDK